MAVDQTKDHARDALVKSFNQAVVRLTSIPASGGVGGFIVWDGFDDLDEKERQDRIWAVLRSELTPAEQMELSAIFALTSQEFQRTQEEAKNE